MDKPADAGWRGCRHCQNLSEMGKITASGFEAIGAGSAVATR